jgi:hypothetical protein
MLFMLLLLLLPVAVVGQYFVEPTPSPYAAIQDTNMGVDSLINTEAWEIEGDLENSWTLQSGTTGANPDNVRKRNMTGPQGRKNGASWWDGASMYIFGGRGYANGTTSVVGTRLTACGTHTLRTKCSVRPCCAMRVCKQIS